MRFSAGILLPTALLVSSLPSSMKQTPLTSWGSFPLHPQHCRLFLDLSWPWQECWWVWKHLCCHQKQLLRDSHTPLHWGTPVQMAPRGLSVGVPRFGEEVGEEGTDLPELAQVRAELACFSHTGSWNLPAGFSEKSLLMKPQG